MRRRRYSGTNSASVVGQMGGSLLQAGAPTPVTNVNLVIPPTPLQCSFTTLAAYATTCPAATDPYQSYSINAAQPFNEPNEYLEQANLNLQKAFGGNVITVGGVTELGRHAPKMLNLQAISNPFQNGVLPLSNEFPWLAKTPSISEYGVYGANSYQAHAGHVCSALQQGLDGVR